MRYVYRRAGIIIPQRNQFSESQIAARENVKLETPLKLREVLRAGVSGAEPLNSGILLSKFHAGADSGATGAAVYRVGAHFRLWSLLCVGLLAGASLRPS